ncbi:MAG: hypothetical protein H6828_14885 [Planctomycetes bacterium]|nr:hypothetical protein [Planctomycetota bacterium]
MSPFESLEISPFCRHLCSKKLLFQKRPPVAASEILDASQHTWCDRTQEAVGPDGDVSDPEDCVRGRGCFTPYGS